MPVKEKREPVSKKKKKKKRFFFFKNLNNKTRPFSSKNDSKRGSKT
jgi:hypothetical protein